MSARSMTGFAEVRRSIGAFAAAVSVKSVNHRGLDVHFHMPPMLDAFERAARAVIKTRVGRGHVQVQVTLTRQMDAPGEETAIDAAALERWAEAYREAARMLGSSLAPDPHDALRAPGVLRAAGAVRADKPGDWPEPLGEALTECLDEALDELNRFRDREGAAIAAEMQERAESLLEAAAGMEEIRARATGVFHARLTEKLADLLRGGSLDPQRLAQEAAILADRSDISEEVMRLKTHTSQLLVLLADSGEKGKKLDFLLQEMNRETNTVLAKTSGLGDDGLKLTGLGLAAKAEIDKMREQALNLE